MHGIGVLGFDFTGLGQSEGEFGKTNFLTNLDDLLSAAEFLEQNYKAPSLLVGHSLGGAAVICSAAKIPSVSAVVTIGAPSDPAHVKKMIKEDIDEIKRKGSAEVKIGERAFEVSKELLDTLENSDMNKHLKEMKAALLIMHSPQDEVVSIDNAALIYREANHPKSFISLDNANHMLSDKRDSVYAAGIIGAWSKRYLPCPQESPLVSSRRVIARIEKGSYTTEIKAGEHCLISDEPVKDGGEDLGPTPYDLLTAGLGACTAMTVEMYAKRKGWDLKEARIHLEHGKIYSKDCEECEQTTAKIDHILREIELEGELTDEQKQRLLEIADKCPVHKTLSSRTHITTSLK
jgi:putative redox protein